MKKFSNLVVVNYMVRWIVYYRTCLSIFVMRYGRDYGLNNYSVNT